MKIEMVQQVFVKFSVKLFTKICVAILELLQVYNGQSYYNWHSAEMQIQLRLALLYYQITVLNLPDQDQET
jgi:hypothetical protein